MNSVQKVSCLERCKEKRLRCEISCKPCEQAWGLWFDSSALDHSSIRGAVGQAEGEQWKIPLAEVSRLKRAGVPPIHVEVEEEEAARTIHRHE